MAVAAPLGLVVVNAGPDLELHKASRHDSATAPHDRLLLASTSSQGL